MWIFVYYSVITLKKMNIRRWAEINNIKCRRLYNKKIMLKVKERDMSG